MTFRALLLLAVGLLPAAFPGLGRAEALEETLLVLTSYPDELVGRFEAAFERANPGADVQILWKTGREAMPILRRPD